MARTGARAAATQGRRRQILDAALECFTKLGYTKTTMADIRQAAGASTGSVYHHFSSKEQLAAELYLEGVKETQQRCRETLLGHRQARAGIEALVTSYITWVSTHPDLASFLINNRHAEFIHRADRAVVELNRVFGDEVRAWMRPHVEAGELPDAELDMYWALLIGPSEYFARSWLRCGAKADLHEAARHLADAAWQAIHALPMRAKRPARRSRRARA
jgi:AcrR family transcriptional regulator